MDLCVHVKNTNLLFRNSISEKPFVLNSIRAENGKVFEISVPKRPAFSGSGYHPLVVKAMAKKKPGNSNSSGKGPDEDSLKGSNPSSENCSSKDTGPQKSHQKLLDWREFRASLCIQEQQAANAVSDAHKQEGTSFGPKPLPLKWAHPISAPENGCVLVATNKLDGVPPFERTVVLLLRSGSRDLHDSAFGVVINRPLGKKIKHMKLTNLDLATTFADCPWHFGGPLETSMFLFRQRSGASSELPRIEEVIPGVSFGALNRLEEASSLVNQGALKPQDFRFFVGYAGWQVDKLQEEIEAGFWYVAACSANLIFAGAQTSSSESLWGEILQLMGGQYSEVSRKPKEDI